jgi:1-aminocyclopropane-1-carboxylate deaminase
MQSSIQEIDISHLSSSCELFIKREDLLHPEISGNKFRKLKYNLLKAKEYNLKTIITFGGAFSNHITATAAACQKMGFQCVGIIRGEELGEDLSKTIRSNPSLAFALECGMKFKFITRSAYREKDSEAFQKKLQLEFPKSYLIPEGGTNSLAIKGCKEILTEEDKKFDIICCPVGTGGTISGIINSSFPKQEVWGFPALKGSFLAKEIGKFAIKNNYQLKTNYHFGGYARVNEELIRFMNQFYEAYKIPLDPIYTGKMVYGIFDMLKNEKIKNKKILLIHTGGFQGIKGMNQKLLNKKKPLITYES